MHAVEEGDARDLVKLKELSRGRRKEMNGVSTAELRLTG